MEHYNDNKEHILDERKEYYKDNKEHILEERKKYYKDINIISNLDSYTLTMNIQTLEYNIIRYQSGIAGLLFLS